ncbi:MAG: hypothetical protein NVS2B14_12120 [Chamaesiphon sp.]
MTFYHFKDRYQTAVEALQALQHLSNPGIPTPTQSSYAPTAHTTAPVSTPQQSQSSWQTAHIPNYAEPTPSPVRQPVARTRHLLPIFVGAGVTAFVVLAAVITPHLLQLYSLNSKSDSKNNALQQSCFADAKGYIRSEPSSIAGDRTVIPVSQKMLPVTGKQTEGGWIEVKLANGRSGWTYLQKVANAEELNSCLQVNKIPIQKVPDAPLIVTRPEPKLKPEPSPKPSDVSDSNADKPEEPMVKTSPAEPPIDSGAGILAQAKQDAESGNLKKAIALAQTIPSNSSDYQNGQKLIATWQQQLNDQATTPPKSCTIVVADPAPPVNVRSSPEVSTNNIVGTLENGQILEVIEDRKGWLYISSPVKGWIAEDLTKKDCQ